MTGIAEKRPWLADLDPALVDETVYGRSQQDLRVFISSEMGSGRLEEQRRAAIAAVEGGRVGSGYNAWHWERDANAGPYSSLDVCLRFARTSDFLVLIIASDLTETTHAEYLAARDAGVHCSIFLLQGANRDAAVQDFVNQERTRAAAALEAELRDLLPEPNSVGKPWGTTKARHRDGV